MNYFLIGDVHGCFRTFQKLLTHWHPATEHLIQLGDLVDRGKGIAETVSLALEISKKHPATTTFLRGNHEAEMLHHFGPQGPSLYWKDWGGRSTLGQYQARPRLLAEHLAWLQTRPLLWENDVLLASHAGIAASPHARDPDHPDGLLWTRLPLLRLPQLQVVGHTPTPDGQPKYHHLSHAWYLDTGACFGRTLSALRLSATAEVLEIISVPTFAADLLPDQN